MFRVLLAALLVIHALIHVMGVAKAFGWAELPQITRSLSPWAGALWLLAAVLCGGTVVLLFASPRAWWLVAVPALIVSQLVIAAAWTDAKYGTIVNVILLAGVVIGYRHDGPRSFNASYARDVAARRGSHEPALLAEADLGHLPPVVQRYVRLSGAVGQPRIQGFRARFKGRIRSGPDARWMPFTGEQVNRFAPPSRLFLMDGSMFGVPLQAFHRYVGPSATMQVRVASLKQVVDARGESMNVAETVTLLNDLCVFAPGAMPFAAIAWEPIDSLRVRATYTNAGHTVHAELRFNAASELVDFISDDRVALSADGRTITPMRWSTPISAYRRYGAFRLAGKGDGVWHAPGGPYSYIEFEIVTVEYNPS